MIWKCCFWWMIWKRCLQWKRCGIVTFLGLFHAIGIRRRATAALQLLLQEHGVHLTSDALVCDNVTSEHSRIICKTLHLTWVICWEKIGVVNPHAQKLSRFFRKKDFLSFPIAEPRPLNFSCYVAGAFGWNIYDQTVLFQIFLVQYGCHCGCL